jgi:senataxin
VSHLDDLPEVRAQITDFETLLILFTSLLGQSPNHHIWTFDTSPELPHTLFSDIKNNPSFQSLLESTYGPDIAESGDKDLLSWISDYLVSLVGSSSTEVQKLSVGGKEASGFGEALAKVASFCFSEMQHTRLDPSLRAAVANQGIKVSSESLFLRIKADNIDHYSLATVHR